MTTPKTYSVQVRVQRILREDAFVSVPVTPAVLRQGDDGDRKIDAEALLSAALRIAQDPQVTWQEESIEIASHPLQTPLPDCRTVFAGSFPEE